MLHSLMMTTPEQQRECIEKKLLPVDFTMSEFKAMTVQQLKLRLKEFGVSTQGKKTDLVER